MVLRRSSKRRRMALGTLASPARFPVLATRSPSQEPHARPPLTHLDSTGSVLRLDRWWYPGKYSPQQTLATSTLTAPPLLGIQ